MTISNASAGDWFTSDYLSQPGNPHSGRIAATRHVRQSLNPAGRGIESRGRVFRGHETCDGGRHVPIAAPKSLNGGAAKSMALETLHSW
jgi:hypothetical protein